MSTPRLGTDIRGPSLVCTKVLETEQESIENESYALDCTHRLITKLNVGHNGFNETVGNIIQKIEDEDGVNQDPDIPPNLFEKAVIVEETSSENEEKQKKKVVSMKKFRSPTNQQVLNSKSSLLFTNEMK